MHWFGLALLPANTKDIDQATQILLAPFDLNLEVELHKEYFRFWQVNIWRQYLKTDDPALIAAGMRKTPYGNEEIGFDDAGLYHITTHNSQSQWDFWDYGHGDLMIGEERWKNCMATHPIAPRTRRPAVCNLCRVAELPADILPVSVITPDGVWHDTDDFADRSQLDLAVTDQQWLIWRDHVRELLDKHNDQLAVGIYFHS